MSITISNELLTLLQQTDTPTICNSIELAQGKRGFNQFTRGKVETMLGVSNNKAPLAMAGFARTAKISAEQPAFEADDIIKQRRMDYYRYMSEGARPAICVIEDIDDAPVGAFWGEVNTNIHRGFGISGTLTNGMMRDIGVCPDDYQVIAGGISVSHRFVHVRDIGTKITVFGMAVNEGDFIHADHHGACIIPVDILPDIDKWIAKMQTLEAIIIEPSKQDNFDFTKFTTAWAEYEKQRV